MIIAENIPKYIDLSPEAIDAGEKFLALLDEYGLGVQGAGWIYFRGLREWRYYIVTSLVDIDGLAETHDRIGRLFTLKFQSEALTIDDLYLMSPNERIFKSIAMIRMNNSLVFFENVILNDVHIEKGVFYRAILETPAVITAKQSRQKFDRKLKELERVTTGPPK